MGDTRWRLFRLLGIPIFIHPSWLIVLALLTLSLAGGYPDMLQEAFPGEAPRVPWYASWAMGLITAAAFFTCILLHELGHALVARARGVPIRGITLFLFGGVAEIEDEPPSPGTEFLMAVAGPAVSACLVAVLGVLALVGSAAGWPHPVVLVLGCLAALNSVVLVFNLVPAFPLDGGRVLRALLWAVTGSLRRSTYWASAAGQAFSWLLVGWGLIQLFTGDWLGGIWIAVIGLFLNAAARGAYEQLLVRQALQGEPIRRFMNPEPIAVAPSLDLRTWVNDYVYRYHRKAFPVVSGGRLEGVITTGSLAQVPRAEWPEHTVGEVMGRELRAVTVAPDADALEALARMRQTGSSRLLVAEGDRLVGTLTLRDLLQFLGLKIELDGEEAAAPGAGKGPHSAGPGPPAVPG
jgi:Zn-dependent protease/CBS domain-containing protein